METFEAILNRRSIRKYIQDKPIPAEFTEKILEAAMYAPSARNTQSTQFMVIDKREILDHLAVVHPYAKMLKYAPLAILVCGDREIEETEAYLNTNASAAAQNLLLAAQALGIGSVWLGVYPREERMKAVGEALNIPAHIVPIALVSLGWPDETKERPARFLPERIHYNGTW